MLTNISRTSKSIKNTKIALCFYVINLILQFYSRKIFLDYLGSEVLGLNTTAQNLLGFLNLAELGIGGAVAYNLYKPLCEKNEQIINDIVSIQGWLYRRIAYFIIIASCVLMFFFPVIFEKAKLPLWYTYGSYIALLSSSLLSYFVNYKQIVLSADQKEYKITFSVQGIKVVKIIFQILVIRFLDNGYLYWIMLELLMAVVTSVVLNTVIKKEYPWLNPVLSDGYKLQKCYPEIIKKTKQLFFHKIGSFVLSQTSPIVIYAYASLSLVAVYGNYMLIVGGVIAMVGALMNSIAAGIGNLVASVDQVRVKSIFWELTTVKTWIASIICFGMYYLGHSFIALWVGEEYILPQSSYIILIVITYISLSRTNDFFLAAYGLYQDIYAPLVEAVLNLGLSVLLGYYYGLTGILCGVLISLLIVVVGWKPYFLYRYGFHCAIMEYIVKQLKYILIIIGAFFLFECLRQIVWNEIQINNFMDWIKYGVSIISIYSVLTLVLFYVTETGMRDFILRLRKYLRVK